MWVDQKTGTFRSNSFQFLAEKNGGLASALCHVSVIFLQGEVNLFKEAITCLRPKMLSFIQLQSLINMFSCYRQAAA